MSLFLVCVFFFMKNRKIKFRMKILVSDGDRLKKSSAQLNDRFIDGRAVMFQRGKRGSKKFEALSLDDATFVNLKKNYQGF